MELLEKKTRQKSGVTLTCEKCSFVCYRKWDWNMHIKTIKHKTPLFGIEMELNHGKKTAKSGVLGETNDKFICDCGKKYNSQSGLWKHTHNSKNSVCKSKSQQPELPAKNDDIIKYLMNENKELKNMIMEICKKESIQNNTTNNNTINQTNKTFNLQFFLNETCKDAMNISEFIENISLQLSDLENMGKVGYVEGISNIIIKNLKALDVEKRPLHCSDVKREIMYVKDEDKWEKENDDKKKIKQVISSVVNKNIKLLPEFQKKYPECMKSESKKSDEYNLIIMEAMRNVDKNKEKIIKKIAKEVTIEKG